MNRRQFARQSTLALAVAGLSATAFKCGSAQVTIYVQTIISFLREISAIIPAQASFIGKIIAIATDLDAAYKRGDFDNAMAFLESLTSNLNTLIANLGLNVSDRVKVALAIIGSTVRLIAVLLKQQAEQPEVAAAISTRTDAASIRRKALVAELANSSEIEKLYQAAKP